MSEPNALQIAVVELVSICSASSPNIHVDRLVAARDAWYLYLSEAGATSLEVKAITQPLGLMRWFPTSADVMDALTAHRRRGPMAMKTYLHEGALVVMDAQEAEKLGLQESETMFELEPATERGREYAKRFLKK